MHRAVRRASARADERLGAVPRAASGRGRGRRRVRRLRRHARRCGTTVRRRGRDGSAARPGRRGSRPAAPLRVRVLRRRLVRATAPRRGRGAGAGADPGAPAAGRAVPAGGGDAGRGAVGGAALDRPVVAAPRRRDDRAARHRPLRPRDPRRGGGRDLRAVRGRHAGRERAERLGAPVLGARGDRRRGDGRRVRRRARHAGVHHRARSRQRAGAVGARDRIRTSVRGCPRGGGPTRGPPRSRPGGRRAQA